MLGTSGVSASSYPAILGYSVDVLACLFFHDVIPHLRFRVTTCDPMHPDSLCSGGINSVEPNTLRVIG
jgi:hypothetical protein